MTKLTAEKRWALATTNEILKLRRAIKNTRIYFIIVIASLSEIYASHFDAGVSIVFIITFLLVMLGLVFSDGL